LGTDDRTINLPDAQVTVSGADLIIDPTADLLFSNAYEVTISAGAIQDTAAVPNGYAGTSSGDWNFTTTDPDLTPPVITLKSPLDDAVGITPGTSIVATFDEDIIIGTGNITLVDVTDGSGTQVIAATDGTQVSAAGNVLTITPTSSLEGATNYAVQIDAGAVKNTSNTAFVGILAPDVTTWNFLVTSEVTFTTSANLGTNNDTWTAGANWDIGSPPSGSLSATINPGLTALANSTAVVTYSGGLTIEAGATLQVGSGGSTEGRTQSADALGTGTITMEAGSKIQWQMKVSPTVPDLVLNGDASIVTSSNESHNRNFNFSAISGSGQLTFLGVNNQQHTFDTASPSWSGGFVSGVAGNARTRFIAAEEGVFGTGDVTIGALTDLQINNNNGGAGNAIDDGAALALDGFGRDQSSAIKVIMNGSETVNLLSVDGFPYPAGTYGRTGLGGVDTELSLFSGNSVLTVTSENDPGSVTVTSFDGVGASGSTSTVYVGEPVTYTVTFSGPLDGDPVTGDFDNSAAAAITVDSVTPISTSAGLPHSYEVVVTPNAAGSLNFGVNSGAVLTDLFGNTLAVPTYDNDTITVVAPPEVAGELGVWKPWANGGINPATGAAWAAGDTYRLVFITGQTTDAYNAFVQGVAASSATYPDLGNGTWRIVASTLAVNAKDNTETDPTTDGTGVAVLLLDGSTVAATNNTDIWNGINVPVQLDENLQTVSEDRVFTGSNSNGTALGSTGDTALGVDSSPGDVSGVGTGNNTKTGGGWMRNFKAGWTNTNSVFAMSLELTLQDTSAPADPFDAWATSGSMGAVTFGGDTNGDGVQDGMAFLLGVANPDDDANGNLPAVSEDGSGNLVMTFECLAIADRGTATLNVQHSGDLAAWAPLPNGVLVPDASGGPTDGVTFVVGDGSDGPGGLNGVTATID
ncbi:MAG: Ig-like domain-containing protein, partial [Haloferula sp.]